MNQLEHIQGKIVTLEGIEAHISALKKANKNIVFTNGCFDILHRGHIDYLAKAADYGKLIVGVNSDDSVRTLNKGSNRPLQDESSRALLLASLSFVEAVVIFNEPTPLSLIEKIVPNVLVKGGDYTIPEIVGHEIVQQHGGLVTTIPLVPGYSTSSIETKIRHSKK
jgi:rfaE bifunctional protein nucleotidyltransferase chain/domain